jgi:hypothetical protein
VVVHDDGSLEEWQVRHVEEKWPGSTVVQSAAAGDRMVPVLAPYPCCARYRAAHPFGFKLLGPAGEMVIDQPDPLTRFYFAPVAGTQKAVLSIPRIGQFLNGGHYRVDCWIGLAQTEYVVQLQDVAVFELPAVDLYGTGMAAEARKHGHTAVKAVWNCRAEEKGGG